MSINKDVNGKEITDCQMMIDLTAKHLFGLRSRDYEESNELIRSDIRAQEVNLLAIPVTNTVSLITTAPVTGVQYYTE